MADMFVIEGGRALNGSVTANGAKNSALKLFATALLGRGTSTLTRVPRVADAAPMSDVLRHLGATVDWTGDNSVEISVPDEIGVEAPYEPVRRMRASTAVLGPLIARQGKARVALPGGCNLGHRGIDLHVRGLEAMGAHIEVVHGYLEAVAPELRGTRIKLDYPSHGATETLVMAATLAKGETIIESASKEPEIHDLAKFLVAMGAHIDGVGTDTITIEGVDGLKAASIEVMADRLEAATFLFAAGATGGEIVVEGCDPHYMTMVLEALEASGMEVTSTADSVKLVSNGQPIAVDVSTLPYPGFPTDLQPLIVAMLCRADGLSIVTENIFDGRSIYVDELARMGADIRAEGHYIVVRGGTTLTGAPVRSPDLRGGAALVVAGLVAQGSTAVEGVNHIDRGYEKLELRLQQLGANIRRVPAGSLVDV